MAGTRGTAVQVVAALALCAGLVTVLKSGALGDGRTATQPPCSPVKTAARAGFVTPSQVCAALYRSDLPAILGMPGEKLQSPLLIGDASGPTGSKGSLDEAAAAVDVGPYTVRLGVDDGTSTVHDGVDALPGLSHAVSSKPVLGHPAEISSMNVNGMSRRVLQIAWTSKDSGGVYDLEIWRSDGLVPDDATVLKVAQQVLPTVPNWAAS